MSNIRELIERRETLAVYCGAWIGGRPCFHGAPIDLEALAARLGHDHGALHADLVGRFRCSRCGSREVSFRIGSTHGRRL